MLAPIAAKDGCQEGLSLGKLHGCLLKPPIFKKPCAEGLRRTVSITYTLTPEPRPV